MTVIHFPDRKWLALPDGISRPVSVFSKKNNAHSQAIASAESGPFSKHKGDNEAVRHFALMVADQLLKDRELNHAAPFLVDKVVRMLIDESRQVQKLPR
ncbi:hypothetical protein SD961_01405 [Erwinia sp. MMLR14_017]|uniref:hypothetical protein n=1 Tax=Erwinia sp. MMLR14_017 TaxID=3093842 RepID=UPI0029906589|nr:hypothetical protein [Erwinia sp. MMLR14_017]MDW8844560.1 hypothetical protein [Erwinia sp. MMLR14_017]